MLFYYLCIKILLISLTKTTCSRIRPPEGSRNICNLLIFFCLKVERKEGGLEGEDEGGGREAGERERGESALRELKHMG
jgi:hypothetical protein